MILILFISFHIWLLRCSCYGQIDVNKFNNSVLTVKPWGMQCRNEEFDKCEYYGNASCDGTMCKNGICNINVAILLPNDTQYIVNLNEGKKILNETVQLIRQRQYLQNAHFHFHLYDDGCDLILATRSILREVGKQKCTHVLFGPVCDYPLAIAGRIVQYIGYGGIPLFSPTGFTFDFTLKKTEPQDEMYMLINSGYADYRSYSEFMHLIMDKYKWTKIVLMYNKYKQTNVSGNSSCHLFMSSIMEEIRLIPDLDYVDGDLELLKMDIEEFLITKVGVNYAIILTCTDWLQLREIVLKAQKLKMFERSEYLFFNFETYNNATNPSQPWNDPNDSINNELAKEAFRYVYTFTPIIESDFPYILNHTIRGYSYLQGLQEGLLIYAQALNRSLNDTINQSIQGCDVVSNIMGATFEGSNGNEIKMNCNGQRVAEYVLLNSDKDGNLQVVAQYSTLNKTIDFWDVQWPNGDPLDTPKCGYNMSKCPPAVSTVTVMLISLIVTVVFTGVAVIIMYRLYINEKKRPFAWKIDCDDLIEGNRQRQGSNATIISIRAQQKYADIESLAGDRYNSYVNNVGFYKSETVKIIHLKEDQIVLTKENIRELNNLKDLSNNNLLKFYGASFDNPRNLLLFEYCSKGTLQDILEHDQLKLDFTFKLSLIMDLIRGMICLHSSPIKFHGKLKSPNCLIDSRFVLKITGFGLHFLEPYYNATQDESDSNSYCFWGDLLWTAPEILRNKFNENNKIYGKQLNIYDRQKADVYSFGIIFHEILTRQGVFHLDCNKKIEPKEIVETLKQGPDPLTGQILRPLIGDALNKDVADLMNKCWAEESNDRPDFSSLKKTLRQINKESDGSNLMDNLLARMEQYANNLESLVEERTADYLEEKKKCEELLYQLLPKSVALQLINGNRVIAEIYDQVTIYFSDIVGFTALSAQSTPLQVVDLLNDLYVMFDNTIGNYDVYKVETIGDAYMVVSGLPERNGNEHAKEIALMSLELLKVVKNFKIRHRPGEPLQLRIGIHTGPCVAGVVGTKMPRYCLFGDTVNTASRMESTGHPLKIHVSPVTKSVLDKFEAFDLACRGEVEMKGKGKMTTYWLNGCTKDISANTNTLKTLSESNQTGNCISNTCNNINYKRTNSQQNATSNHSSALGENENVPLLSVTSTDNEICHTNNSNA